MAEVPTSHALALAAALLAIGLAGLLARRNLVFTLVAIEVMLNAAGLAFIAAGARWGQADGQAMFLFVLSLAGSEVAVGLGLILAVHRQHHSLDADGVSDMGG